MACDRVARRLIAATVAREFPVLDRAIHQRLVDEHCALFDESEASRWHVARIADRDLLIVDDDARAWIAAWDRADEESREDAWLLPSSVTRVLVGGPPGGYVVSGVAASDETERRWFERAGFVTRSTHVDLAVTLHAAPLRDQRVRRARADESDVLVAWVAKHFATAWGREIARSMRADRAVFVADGANGYAGFAAHSGHNAAVGTFGPVGVHTDGRGNGLGAALTRAALDDLFARGFTRATIPWVDPERVAFYRRLVRSVDVVERVMLAMR